MPLLDLYRAVRDASRDPHNAYQPNSSKLGVRLLDAHLRTWDLGLTAFGGPAVHFHILHQRFVEGSGGKAAWIDERTYQELFALCQALPGPSSTKLLFCIVLIRDGLVPALWTFFLWSLPGAVVMFAMSIVAQHMGEILPDPVYGLLSGLNASTVGVIAVAAVQLAEGAITDRVSRIIVIFGACAGICYNALWYFPVLMAVGGMATIIWDRWLFSGISKFRKGIQKRRQDSGPASEEARSSLQVHGALATPDDTHQSRNSSSITHRGVSPRPLSPNIQSQEPIIQNNQAQNMSSFAHGVSYKVGLVIIVCFFASFTATIVARSIIQSHDRLFALFANVYLAGTLIFGGGPVVIPLLREYFVEPGWVITRDFLLGLAIIQALPGPNFNFTVFLGALAVQGTKYPSPLGALLAIVTMNFPGLVLTVAVQSFWRKLRTWPIIASALRGINAIAVGLVFTAVYRLWEIGYLTKGASTGQSLGKNPWWVVVATVAYTSTKWFKNPPALAILLGGVLGLLWYGAVGR